MTDVNEQLVITAAQAGDREAFGQLYDRTVTSVFRYLYYRIGHRESAEDLTSQTFMKALEKIVQYDAAKGSWHAWVLGIAHHVLIDSVRAKKVTTSLEAIGDVPAATNVEHDAELRLRLEKIMNALQQLPPPQPDILIMRLWQDLPFKEIATVLGLTEGQCKMTVARFVKKMMVVGMLLFMCLVTN